METIFTPAQTFTEAIGWMLLHSLWIGVLLALLTAPLLKSIPSRKSVLRYRIAWSSLIAFLMLSCCLLYIHWPEAGSALSAKESAELTLFAERQISKTTIFLKLLHVLKNALPQLVQYWSIGLAFFLLRFLWGFRQMQQYRHKGLRPIPGIWLERFSGYASEMGITHKAVQLFESLLVQTPMLIGHFKPLILLPAGAIAQAPPEYIESVLRHELAHIRRSDFLVSILQNLVEVVFYFNPFVWWISGQIRKEREHCCDDLAVGYSGKPQTYARALLYFQQSANPQAPLQAATLLPKNSRLFLRIQRLLSQETSLQQPKKFVMEKIIATLMLLFGVLFFAFQPAEANVQAPSPKTNTALLLPNEPAALSDTLPEAPKAAQEEEEKNLHVTVTTSADSSQTIVIVQQDGAQSPNIIIDTIITFDPETSKETTEYVLFWKDLDMDELQMQIANDSIASVLIEQVDGDSLNAVLSQMATELKQLQDSLMDLQVDLSEMIPNIPQSTPMNADVEIDTIITFDPETFEETMQIVVHVPPAEERQDSTSASDQPIIITTRKDELSSFLAPPDNSDAVNYLIKLAHLEGRLPDKTNFTFLLTPKKLVIDGKKQPQAVFEKYKSLYEKKSGQPLEGKIKVKMSKSTSDNSPRSGPWYSFSAGGQTFTVSQ